MNNAQSQKRSHKYKIYRKTDIQNTEHSKPEANGLAGNRPRSADGGGPEAAGRKHGCGKVHRFCGLYYLCCEYHFGFG